LFKKIKQQENCARRLSHLVRDSIGESHLHPYRAFHHDDDASSLLSNEEKKPSLYEEAKGSVEGHIPLS
jgi:hypothetical protein